LKNCEAIFQTLQNIKKVMQTMLDLSQYPSLNTPARILLGPGPSTADPRILRAMAAPLLGHLDPAFLQLMDRIQELLRYTFETQNSLTFAVPGTGMAAMETCVANLVEPGDPVLVCINGFFSQRIAEIARRCGGSVSLLNCPWGETASAAEVKAALEKTPAKIVGIVQAETSTGVLQPISEIAKVVHEQGGLLIVDAVTSLGGVPVRVDASGIDACYSCSQKCLGCPPGASPVTFSPQAVEKINARKAPSTTWYLDAALLSKYWGSERMYHHTAPITLMYALYEGLRIVAEEGLEARFARHRANAELLWQGLGEIGLEPFAPLQHRLPTLTTVRIPSGVDDLTIRKRLLSEYNIEIGGGLGELKGKVWRVGLMGFSSRPEYIVMLLGALKRLIGA
jgi:alanine-glyoxylate transaminase / serine-glyoxylate transaminase / serine-pyruvate transaminase